MFDVSAEVAFDQGHVRRTGGSSAAVAGRASVAWTCGSRCRYAVGQKAQSGGRRRGRRRDGLDGADRHLARVRRTRGRAAGRGRLIGMRHVRACLSAPRTDQRAQSGGKAEAVESSHRSTGRSHSQSGPRNPPLPKTGLKFDGDCHLGAPGEPAAPGPLGYARLGPGSRAVDSGRTFSRCGASRCRSLAPADGGLAGLLRLFGRSHRASPGRAARPRRAGSTGRRVHARSFARDGAWSRCARTRDGRPRHRRLAGALCGRRRA